METGKEWANYTEAFFMGELYDENEIWKFYKPFEGEMPTQDDLSNIKGIIIAGTNICDDTLGWVTPVKRLIKKIHKQLTHIKLIGISIGHALIAEALGGKVSKLVQPPHLIIKRSKVNLRMEFFNYFKEIKDMFPSDEEFYLVKTQYLEIEELPEGSINLA
jgi:hypothetical protein